MIKFDQLPEEIITHIFSLTTEPSDPKQKPWEFDEKRETLRTCKLVSKTFNRIASTSFLWKPRFNTFDSNSDKPFTRIHLRPKKSPFSFDELMAKIERKINPNIAQTLGWNLIYEYKVSENTLYRRVSILKGPDFQLEFVSPEGSNKTNLNSITIPKMKLETFDDYSGGLGVYIGNQWEKDKEEFSNAEFHCFDDCLSPRRYLFYPPCTYNDPKKPFDYPTDALSKFFTKHILLGLPIPQGQPQYYERKAIDQKITHYLQENVLKPIESHC